MSWLDTWRAFIGTVPPVQDTQTPGDGMIVLAPRPAQFASALPRNLTRLREAKGWGPTQLAARAKVSASTVRGMETPEYYDKSGKWNSPNPTLTSLLAVAEALEVGIGELVEEREL